MKFFIEFLTQFDINFIFIQVPNQYEQELTISKTNKNPIFGK